MAWLIELTTSDGRVFHHAGFGWADEGDPRAIRYDDRERANKVRPTLWHGHRADKVRIKTAPQKNP